MNKTLKYIKKINAIEPFEIPKNAEKNNIVTILLNICDVLIRCYPKHRPQHEQLEIGPNDI